MKAEDALLAILRSAQERFSCQGLLPLLEECGKYWAEWAQRDLD